MKRKNISLVSLLTVVLVINVAVCFGNRNDSTGEIGIGVEPIGMACSNICHKLEEGMDYCHKCWDCKGLLGSVGYDSSTCKK